MYKETTLDNGLKILLCEDSSLPIIDLRLVFNAGSRYEGSHQKGYAHILEHMLMKGTKKRPSPVLLAREIDNKGGYRNAQTSRETLILTLQVADNYSEELFEFLSDTVLNSLIDSKILENEKKVILEELRKSEDNNEISFTQFIYETLFKGHPLATNILGDPESISSATAEKLKAYSDSFILPGNAILLVAGNITQERVLELAQRCFKEWPVGSKSLPVVDFKGISERFNFHTKAIKQTLLAYNFYTVPHYKTRDLLAFDLIQNFLNFGASSILKEELRHKRGLVYSINLYNAPYTDAGFLSIRTSTSKPKEVIETIEDILRNLKNSFTEDHLEVVKARRIGSFKLYIANPYHQTDFLLAGFRARGTLVTPEEFISEINSISYKEVIDVIDTYLVPEKAVITAMGPEEFTYNLVA